MVFAFDGDRAGRAAAWRALQQALPEAREGREIRFLFLPQGHDPDTLVAAEGREAFEERARAAPCRCRSTWCASSPSRATSAHADGRARFAPNARPLFAKVPAGVYRELLLERLAQVVGLSAARLEELWSAAAAGRRIACSRRRRCGARRAHAAGGGGRGSLVRQAIVRLLHYPADRPRGDAPPSAPALMRARRPGVGLLRELLDNLREQPAQIPAQVIQRWEGREGGEALQKLLEREEVITGSPRRGRRAAGGAREARRPGRRPASGGARGQEPCRRPCLPVKLRNFRGL